MNDIASTSIPKLSSGVEVKYKGANFKVNGLTLLGSSIGSGFCGSLSVPRHYSQIDEYSGFALSNLSGTKLVTPRPIRICISEGKVFVRSNDILFSQLLAVSLSEVEIISDK